MRHTGLGISMVKALMLSVSLFAIGSCSSPSSTATPTTPAVISTRTPSPSQGTLAPFRQFVEAVNKADVDGALNVFADDVVWERGGQCPAAACVGKQAVQREIARDVANHHVMTIVGADESERKLSMRIELRTDGTRRANVERIIQIFSLEQNGDKIAAVRVGFDTSDPVTAAFVATQARQGQ